MTDPLAIFRGEENHLNPALDPPPDHGHPDLLEHLNTITEDTPNEH